MTDGQTDRRTDGQTEFSSLGHVCIACSAVKSDDDDDDDYDDDDDVIHTARWCLNGSMNSNPELQMFRNCDHFSEKYFRKRSVNNIIKISANAKARKQFLL